MAYEQPSHGASWCWSSHDLILLVVQNNALWDCADNYGTFCLKVNAATSTAVIRLEDEEEGLNLADFMAQPITDIKELEKSEEMLHQMEVSSACQLLDKTGHVNNIPTMQFMTRIP